MLNHILERDLPNPFYFPLTQSYPNRIIYLRSHTIDGISRPPIYLTPLPSNSCQVRSYTPGLAFPFTGLETNVTPDSGYGNISIRGSGAPHGNRWLQRLRFLVLRARLFWFRIFRRGVSKALKNCLIRLDYVMPLVVFLIPDSPASCLILFCLSA